MEIEVVRPPIAVGRDATGSARHRYATAIRGQICFEATCPACRAFWNEVIHRAGHGRDDTRSLADPAVDGLSSTRQRQERRNTRAQEA